MPGVTGTNNFGFIEIGTFLGYAGLFALVVSRTLSSALLVPKNHPYLGECMDHHLAMIMPDYPVLFETPTL